MNALPAFQLYTMHRDLQGLRSKRTGVASRADIFLNYEGKNSTGIQMTQIVSMPFSDNFYI